MTDESTVGPPLWAKSSEDLIFTAKSREMKRKREEEESTRIGMFSRIYEQLFPATPFSFSESTRLWKKSKAVIDLLPEQPPERCPVILVSMWAVIRGSEFYWKRVVIVFRLYSAETVEVNLVLIT